MKHPVIDATKLAFAMVKANVTQKSLEEALHSHGRFTQWAWSKMLTGMKPNPRHWTVICNLLGVPLNAFDLAVAPKGLTLEQWHRGVRGSLGMGPHPDDASSQRVTSAERGHFYRELVQRLLRGDSGKSPAHLQTADGVRSALLGTLATVVECLQALHAPIAPLQFPQGLQSASSPSASAHSHRTSRAGQARPGKAQPAAAKKPGSGSSAKPATPPAAKQAAKPATA